MLLNRFLFPAPNPPHYTAVSHRSNLFWIPPSGKDELPIPCMFYPPHHSSERSQYLIIFSHGNGCDIGSMHYTLTEFSRTLNAYVVSFEYPSYGLCTASSPNQRTINNHADRTFAFVRNTLGWPAERIIIFGHSIGTGAACYIASTRAVHALILQSPFTSISDIVREKVGVLSLIVDTRSWDSLEAMKQIHCPVLFIHGLEDNVIPSSHSESLYQACPNKEESKLVLLPHEHHNSMTEPVLLKYIIPFFRRHCPSNNSDPSLPVLNIPREFRQSPQPVENADGEKSSPNLLASIWAKSRASTAATQACIRSVSGKRDTESNES